MERQVIVEACNRAQYLRLVDARRCSSIARAFPRMAFTTTREYMEAPTLQYLNAAADAVQAGLRPYLISDEALLVNADPFVPVISVGIEPVRLPQKWRNPDELVPVMAPFGPLLVVPTTLLAWQ